MKKFEPQDKALPQNFIGMLRFFLRAYPGRSALVFMLLFLGGFAEGLSIVSLLPLLGGVLGEGAASDSISVLIQDALAWFGLSADIGVLLGVIVVAVIFKALLTMAALVLASFASARVLEEMRIGLLKGLMCARWSYFSRQPIGRLSNAISSEAARGAAAYRGVVDMGVGITQALILVVLVFSVSWRVALAAALFGLLILVLLRGVVAMARRAGERQTELMQSLITRLTDGIAAIKPIKAMAMEGRFGQVLQEESSELRIADYHRAFSNGLLRASHEVLIVIFLGAAAYVALVIFKEPIAELMVTALLFIRLVSRLGDTQKAYQKLINKESAFWAIHNAIADTREEQEQLAGGNPPPQINAGLSLRDVGFSYGSYRVFENISITLPARQLTVLVGPSGAGKTTIIDLFSGLHQPAEGAVMLEQQLLSDTDIHQWRAQVGYVPQEVLLLNDTIHANVTLNDPEIGEAEVEEALQLAGAWEFVASRVGGVNSQIGERGSQLSGGQRQRISIARALVRKPQLLILDEATANLDYETERALCKLIHTISRKVTVLAVSHRQPLVDVADCVYRVEGGFAVAERGCQDGA